MSQTSPCPNCGVVHPFGNENCPKAEMRTFPVPAPEVETRPAGQPLHLVAPQTAIGAEDDGYDLLRLRVTDADLPFTAGCRALLDRLLRDNFTRVVNERHPNIGDEIAKVAKAAASSAPAETTREWGDEVRYLTDDRDLRERYELVIMQGGNGDWYIATVPEGHKAINGVRLSTSGGASFSHPGLTNAIADAYRALRPSPGRSGE